MSSLLGFSFSSVDLFLSNFNKKKKKKKGLGLRSNDKKDPYTKISTLHSTTVPPTVKFI